jgi:hypothetical protein
VSGAARPPSESFAWTKGRISLELAGADRRVDWTCAIRYRGGRPAPHPQPAVVGAIDGVRVATAAATNDYQDLEMRAPARRDRAGLTLTVTIDPIFVPGGGDSRELGIQIDRLACRPADGAFLLPPRATLLSAIATGASSGAAFALAGIALPLSAGGAATVAVMQAVAVTTPPAAYGSYPETTVRLSIAVLVVFVGVVLVTEALRRTKLTAEARFAIAFSAGAVLVKLLGLFHPLKPIVDALFHAHRFEWVLDGRYFFTQPMPSGVTFPYAIGLYVFAAPWTAFTTDEIALLRIVVTVSEAIAAALLYPTLAALTRDGRLAAAAVVAWHLFPLPYVVVGNANLTYAFGESAALVTMLALVWHAGRGELRTAGLLLAAAALAFLSHVGVFPVLAVKLLVAALLLGLAAGAGRRLALSVVAATLLAAMLSTAVYYGHFPEVYQSLDRVLGRAAPSSSSAPATSPAESGGAADPIRGLRAPTVAGRIEDDAALFVRDAGWPLVVLAAVGIWPIVSRHRRDRLAIVVLAWLVTHIGFMAFAVLAPVEPRFERYTTEFVSRLNYSTLPAVAVLAAYGAAWLSNAGVILRAGALALLVAGAAIAQRAWASWFQSNG